MGAPTALAARSMTRRASALAKGRCRGVLRPEDEVGACHLARLHLVGQPLCLARVVVEYGPALGVEAESGARHVALDHGDGRGAVLRRVADQRPGGHGAHHGYGHAEECHRRGTAPHLVAAAGPDGQAHGLVEGEAAQDDREAENRRAADRCERQEHAVRLAERDLAPGKPSKGARARAASPAIHTAAAHTGDPGSFDTAATPAPTAATKSASIAASASQGPGPTSTPVHTSRGSRKPRPKR